MLHLMMASCRRDQLSFLLLLGAAAVLLIFVGAARAHDENFKGLYAKNMKALVDDFHPIASAGHNKREEGKCWPGFSPEKVPTTQNLIIFFVN
jgi:hypothetical protein